MSSGKYLGWVVGIAAAVVLAVAFFLPKALQSRKGKTTAESPEALLQRVNEFAPVLLERYKVRDARLRETAPPSMKETFVETTTYDLGTTDVKKSDSLIDPVVGVIQIKVRQETASKRLPELSRVEYSTVTVTIGPRPDGTWKCLKAERRIDVDSSSAAAPPRPSRVGEVADITKWMSELFVEPQ